MVKIQRTELATNDAAMVGLTNINVLLGRNGSGKSRFLRRLDSELAGKSDFNVRYISPERSGVFQKDGNADLNMERDGNWLRSARSKNQAERGID